MDRDLIIRRLVERTADDFLSYFERTPHKADAERIIVAAVGGVSELADNRDVLEAILPDTDDDGRPEASYALNTGAMVLSLIDYVNTRSEQHYRDAVTLFFDTVDMKVHEEFDAVGVTAPTPEQVASHPLFIQERRWFESLESDS